MANGGNYDEYEEENNEYAHMKAYSALKENTQLMYSGSTYDADLQNFFSYMALSKDGQLESISDHLQDNDKATAALLNGSFSPDNIRQANSKFVNNVLIDELRDSIPYDSTLFAPLFAMAWQNPLIGGEAVYRARALLKLYIDDTEMAYRKGQFYKPLISEQLFNIQPNPNNGIFDLYLKNAPCNECSIEISDALGVVLQRFIKMDSQVLPINLNNLAQGVYFVKYKNVTSFDVQRIVISR